MKDLTHKFDNVTLSTEMTPKGFKLWSDGHHVGIIERVHTEYNPVWLVKVNGSGEPREFNSLKAAEFYALATYMELLTAMALWPNAPAKGGR